MELVRFPDNAKRLHRGRHITDPASVTRIHAELGEKAPGVLPNPAAGATEEDAFVFRSNTPASAQLLPENRFVSPIAAGVPLEAAALPPNAESDAAEGKAQRNSTRGLALAGGFPAEARVDGSSSVTLAEIVNQMISELRRLAEDIHHALDIVGEGSMGQSDAIPILAKHYDYLMTLIEGLCKKLAENQD